MQHPVVEVILQKKDNFYDVLGVSRKATPDEIKRSYRIRAMNCHPDKCPHPKAAEAFKLVAAAYQTLSDPEKRRIYDYHGFEGVRAHDAGHPPDAAAGHNAANEFFYQRRNGDFVEPMSELFEMMFGIPPRHRRPDPRFERRPREPPRGPDGRQDFTGLMMVPFLLILLLTVVLQSSFSSQGYDSTGPAGRRVTDQLFSLAKNTRDGFVFERRTENLSELSPPIVFYVRAGFEETLRRNAISPRSISIQVAKEYRESLGRRCNAEIRRQQTHARSTVTKKPEVCNEYERLRNIPRF